MCESCSASHPTIHLPNISNYPPSCRTDDLNQHEASAEAGTNEKLALGCRRLSRIVRLVGGPALLDKGLCQRLHAVQRQKSPRSPGEELSAGKNRRSPCRRGAYAGYTFGFIPNMTEALNIDEGTLKLKKLVLQRRAA